VLRAFNPMYIIDYFKRNGKKGWLSLDRVFLCITGSEDMFANLDHFSVRSVQVSLLFFSFSSRIKRSFGTHPGQDIDPIYWPTFVVAVVAAIMVSQAMISGAFSIVAQAQSLEKLGHAHGIAVVSAEIITTNLVTLVMLRIWKISIWRISLFYAVYVTIESTYLSAQLSKFVEGGYLPLPA
ncbi:Potassium transporter 5, partial [Datura stramonium]|nr:Potassium transporter 5 [Datura stramonium]